MSGLYLHIPFCKKACHYCNFHFSTSARRRGEMVAALKAELELQKDYLQDTRLASVYWGGGTPSVLPVDELAGIFERIAALYTIAADAEITLEANPDDLSEAYLRDLRAYTPVNRLSIGVQSFSDADLQWMNRAHNAGHARHCIEAAQQAGFDNLSIDLIYGAPTTTDAQWRENLQIAFDYGIPHLSSYCLTVEEGTALHHFVKKGASPPVDEEKAARQFEYLMAATNEAGYEHYEISNFALPGRHAKHNSSYWKGAHYLGIGPSAHSFNGVSRQWNVANNALYIKEIEAGSLPCETEILTPAQQFNEYVMTALRTSFGCSMDIVRQRWPEYAPDLEAAMRSPLERGHVAFDKGVYTLTRSGKLLADKIASDAFILA